MCLSPIELLDMKRTTLSERAILPYRAEIEDICTEILMELKLYAFINNLEASTSMQTFKETNQETNHPRMAI